MFLDDCPQDGIGSASPIEQRREGHISRRSSVQIGYCSLENSLASEPGTLNQDPERRGGEWANKVNLKALVLMSLHFFVENSF